MIDSIIIIVGFLLNALLLYAMIELFFDKLYRLPYRKIPRKDRQKK